MVTVGLGPEAPSCCLETLGLWEEAGGVCVYSHQLTAGSVDWGFSVNLIFNT